MFSKTDIEKYFAAEKTGSLLFIIIGIIAIILALVFLFLMKTNFYKGIAWPLLLIGCIQLTTAYTVYKKSDADRKRNIYAYDLNPTELKNKEIPRMEKVNSNFVLLRWVEIVLIIASVVLIFLYRSNQDKSFLYGLGIGLFIQVIIILTADSFAEARSKTYLNGLKAFVEKG